MNCRPIGPVAPPVRSIRFNMYGETTSGRPPWGREALRPRGFNFGVTIIYFYWEGENFWAG